MMKQWAFCSTPPMTTRASPKSHWACPGGWDRPKNIYRQDQVNVRQSCTLSSRYYYRTFIDVNLPGIIDPPNIVRKTAWVDCRPNHS